MTQLQPGRLTTVAICGIQSQFLPPCQGYIAKTSCPLYKVQSLANWPLCIGSFACTTLFDITAPGPSSTGNGGNWPFKDSSRWEMAFSEIHSLLCPSSPMPAFSRLTRRPASGVSSPGCLAGRNFYLHPTTDRYPSFEMKAYRISGWTGRWRPLLYGARATLRGPRSLGKSEQRR